MAKKGKGSSGSGSSWINTYADVVTLLLTFFAVLLSISSTNEDKFNALIKSMQNLPQETLEEIIGNVSDQPEEEDAENSGLTEMDELYLLLKGYYSENSSFIDIQKMGEVIYIRYNSSIFFEPDQYILLPSSYPILQNTAEGLTAYQENIRMVNILGFTATIDNGRYWMLSAERAAVVASYFNYDAGFPDNKLTVIGYGNQYPVASNDTADGMRQNRRVELIIVGTDSDETFDVNEALQQLYGPGADGSLPSDASSAIPSADTATPAVDTATPAVSTG